MLMILTRDQHSFKSPVPSGDLGPHRAQGDELPLGIINSKTLYLLIVPSLVRPGVCFGFLFVWVFLFCFGFFCKIQMPVGSRSLFLLSELM